MQKGVKVHEWPAIPFVPKEESTKEFDKIGITLQVSPNVTGSDMKNNTTKNGVTKFKPGNLED
eukprot:2161231-Ditylum_brightwellii.AAC.1